MSNSKDICGSDCSAENPLKWDGTSQHKRILKALDPSSAPIDGRSTQDLIDFASNFAEEIKYFDKGNSEVGDWTNFFNSKIADLENQKTEPHYALFLAFLELFKYLQSDLNKITERHLDFYYRDVLQLKEKDPVADQAFVIFNLAKNINSHLVKKGTLLSAGDDDTGEELFYQVDKDTVSNKSQVEELKAVFSNKE
ncbi:MAG: hypothetical protein JKY54_01415, partial [Flavobacteriales bacterium]|nr:hypothetical protein [Flavobacteriales bacterium]